jgi:hypothetical protein
MAKPVPADSHPPPEGLPALSSDSQQAAHQASLSLHEAAEISGHRSLAVLERYLNQDDTRVKAGQSALTCKSPQVLYYQWLLTQGQGPTQR